jgi:hypothetical protein
MDEAKKLALREAIELCKSAPGYKSMCVVHVADEIHQWLTRKSAQPGKAIWATDASGKAYVSANTDPDWPLVT